MPTVEGRARVRAPRAELFDLAQSYERRLAWDPFLRALRFLDGATEAAVGVRVWVRARNGLTMTVRYVTFRRPEVVAMTMTEGPRVLRKFSGSWRFLEAGPGETEVVFRYGYECALGPLNPIAHAVVARALRGDVTDRLAGLKRGAEEGGLLPSGPRAG